MLKKELINIINEDYSFLTSLSPKEYNLFIKWNRINFEKPPTVKEREFLFNVKKDLFIPENQYDYLNIEPKVIPVSTKEQRFIWTTLRKYICSLKWNQNPGRHQKYLVQDKKTKHYLGVISLGSDFTGIGGRNDYIGWNNEQIMKKGMLKYTACGTSIVPVQPFGYNALGGKLIALLTCSDVVENFWNQKYNEPLVGITTTSLHGGYSQYNSLKYWKKCATSEGKNMLDLSPITYKYIKEYIKENHPEEIKNISGWRAKKGCLQFINREFGIKHFNNTPRGVYFCELYKNTRPFLRMETETLSEKKFDNSVETLTEYWRKKAKNRIDKLTNISTNYLFYDDLYGLTWNEVKKNKFC